MTVKSKSSQEFAHLRRRMAELERLEKGHRRFEEELLRLSRRLSECSKLEDVGRVIAEETRKFFNHDAFILCQYVEAENQLIPVYAEDTLNAGEGPVAVDAQIRKSPPISLRAYLINRSKDQEDSTLVPFGNINRRSRSLMFVPICWQNNLIGILSVQSYQIRCFDQQDLQCLQSFADQCGGALMRVKAEEARVRSESIFRQVIENARGVPYQRSYDPERFVFVGDNCLDIIGIPSDQVTCKRFKNMILETRMPDTDSYASPEDYLQAFHSGKIEHCHVDYRIRTPLGQEKWLSDYSVLIHEEGSDRVCGALGIWQDITARIYTEQRLRQAHRMETLGEAIASVAHSIKNLMACIDGSASILDKAIENGDIELLPKAWDLFQGNHRRINTLVQDMLILAKDQKPRKRRTPLLKMLETVVDLVQHRAEQEGVKFILQQDPRIEEVFVDHHAMERCLMNLIENSLEAIQTSLPDSLEGKPELRIQSLLLDGGRSWRLQVSDTGPGIDSEHIHRIFEPFFSTKGYSGTGLGLSVAKKIVQEHGGRIEVSSVPNQGTTFTITLPNGND